MSRTNRNSICRTRPEYAPLHDDDFELHPELVPAVDDWERAAQTRAVLDAVIRAHRPHLVSVARQYLGNRHDAEDLVQDLCVEALEGQLSLSTQPAEALADLLREIRERSESLH
jgi:hypothetical protein